MTTLHSGGKFEGKAYSTSGGLHGVGVSVVNALSTETIIEVARDKKLYRQTFSKGLATSTARRGRRRPQQARHHRHLHPRPGDLRRRRPTSTPAASSASPAPRPISSPASRSAGAATPRSPPPTSPKAPPSNSPAASPTISPSSSASAPRVTNQPFVGKQDFPAADGASQGSAEWAVAWPLYSDGSESYYCNTIPTPDGGTHEAGLRAALTKGIRAFGELVGNKKAKDITADDVFNGVELMLSRVHPQPALPEPDQGPPHQPRGRALRRECGPRPFRPLPRRQYGPRPRAARLDPRADGGAPHAAAPSARSSARPRPPPASSASPASSPTARQRRSRRHRAVHRRGRQRRRLGQAGPRPQDPGDPPHPRQDPQRRQRHRRQDPRQQRDRRPQPRARLRQPRQVRRGCAALREDHHHDRRRRRRRPHRDAC